MQKQTLGRERRRTVTTTGPPTRLGRRADLDIAVIDPVPLFACGVVGVLRDYGFTRCTSSSIVGLDPDLLIVGIRREGDWITVAEAANRERAVGVIAVVPDAEPASFVRAISAGAIGVVPRTAAMGQIVAVVEASLAGLMAVSPRPLRELAESAASNHNAPSLTDDQIRCVQLLAEGKTVAQIARRCGYSERETYRMLERVYRALGVTNRSQALVKAARSGLV